MSILRSIAASGIACALTIACGCASPPPSIAAAGVAPPPVPEDFAIDVAVLSGDPEEGLAPAHLRTGRYILYPGGNLHAGRAPDLTPADLPPWVRSVEGPLLDEVWAEVAFPLLHANEGTASIGNTRLIRKQPGQITHLIEIRVNDQRYQIGRTRALHEQDDPLVARLTRAMAGLAWMSDEPDQDILRIPRRYDFGPDPYARYRSNSGDSSGVQ